MILGSITNSWTQHIYTTELPRLVERARRRGAAHIELRQTCMGRCEEGAGDDWRPATEQLARLARTFPLLSFNLAIAYPCLTGGTDPGSAVFQASLEAARTVGPVVSRLRIVDPARFDHTWESLEELPSAVAGVAELAREAARQGVRLFIENAGQPIRSMALVVQKAREGLSPEEAANLGLCVDPINSMRADPGSDPIAEIEALPLDDIFMVHFKQTREGKPHPTVDDGDLDYPRLVRVLKDKGFDALAVLEIPPEEDVFDNLKVSVEYLNTILSV